MSDYLTNINKISFIHYTCRPVSDRENPCYEFADQEKQRMIAINFQETAETATEERIVVSEGNKIDIKSSSKKKASSDYYEGIVRKSKKDSLRDKRKSARVTIMADSELASEKTESQHKPVRIRPLSVPSGPALIKDELIDVFDKMKGKKRDITLSKFQTESEKHNMEGAGNELKDALSFRHNKKEETKSAPEQ